MQNFFNFLLEIEFYLKIAISCTIFQQLFYYLLHDLELNFPMQVILYWLVGSSSFYAMGILIEKVIKKNNILTEKLTARVSKVKPQPFLAFTVKGIF
jgi:hypothetical protein